MIFKVIQGGLSATQGDAPAFDATAKAQPDRQDVEEEAARRLRLLHYEGWRRRELLVGISMPREIRYLAMQIQFAAQAIASLKRIPPDFRMDSYWPATEAAAEIRTGP
jgi:hypothetical protein